MERASNQLPKRKQYSYQSVGQGKYEKKNYGKSYKPRYHKDRYQKQEGNNTEAIEKNAQYSEFIDRRDKRVIYQKQENKFRKNTQFQKKQDENDQYWIDINSNKNEKENDIQISDQALASKFKDLFLQFQDQQLNDKKIRKISMGKEYGQNDERLLKKALRIYINNKDIKRIDNIYLLIDQAYPYIQVQYSTGEGKKHIVNIIQLIRNINKDEYFQRQLRRMTRLIFYGNYSEVNPKQLSKYHSPIQQKIRKLNLKDYDFSLRRDGAVKSILASYCNFQDQFNFLAIDNYWNQVRFNHLLLISNKEKFSQAYQYYSKLIKIFNKRQQNQKQNNAALLGHQQLSSDDEQIKNQPIQMTELIAKLDQLLNETLQQFQDDIQAKQQQQQQLRNQNKQQQLQKVMEQISELDTNLQLYRQKRLKFIKQKEKTTTDQRNFQIYKQLRMLRNQLSSKLPIISRKKQLFEKLDKHNLIILEGQTGSGKSTQLPQILCEYYNVFGNKNSKSILLTQPRKLSTRTLAQRIASQLDQKVHGFVDYVSSSNKKPQKHSKIVLMLDRLLLDQLEKDPTLSNYHCLILDEAHQRTLSIDILIGLIRKLLTKRQDFKVIITSATLDAALFERYFETKTFKVSGRLFPVQIRYQPFENVKSNVQKIKNILDTQILRGQNREKYRGHILVFCTTVEQINVLCNQYSGRPGIRPLPLHGKLTSEQQRLIFQPEQQLTKLIFSTRIAQTAVTIDKVKVVIDPGQDRQTVYDQKKKITAFQLKPISKSAAKQRAGRAGRTSAGFCFRLYSNKFQQQNMSNNKNPEIKSVPLDTLVLRLKQLKIKDILNFNYIESPEHQDLKQSQDRMQIIGCLDQFHDITEIGLLLVKIPIEPFMSRALAQGIIIDMNRPKRKILPQLLKTLVMIVNGQSIFYSKYGDDIQKQELQRMKFYQFADKQGDFFSLLKVYQAFQQQLDRRNLHRWCKQKFLNKKVLLQAAQLYKQVKQIVDNVKLNTSNIRQFQQQVLEKQRNLKNNKDLILSCILPSFCQQLCLFSGESKIGYTSIKRQVPIQIYGSSFLSLQGINPKWIISFDVFKTSNTFCRLAQAVTFEALRKAVPPRLFKRYKIQQCEKSNPFYEQLKQHLPTVIFDEFRKKNYSNANNQLEFLQSSTVLFYPELNQVQIFMNKNSAIEITQKFQQKIKQMNRQVQETYSKYTHHYLGSVTAIMSSGCETQKLNFSNYLYAIKVYGIQYQYQYIIHVFYSQNVIKFQMNARGIIMYFSEQSHRKDFKEWLDKFKQGYKKQFKNVQIKMGKGFQERKDKIATVKIRVRFFIGQHRSSKNLLLIGYNQEEAQLAVQLMKLYLDDHIIDKRGIKINKKSRPTITIYLRQQPQIMDQVDFQEYVQNKMKRMNVHGWKKPYIYKGFRDLDTQLSLKTEDQWADDIKELIQDVDEDDIFIKGYGPPKSKRFTQIMADIRMYDTIVAEKFKQKYNKKRKILGNQKIHINITYTQTLIKISPYVFTIFNNQFRIKKAEMQAQFTRVKIEQRVVRPRKGDPFVIIQSSSSNRQDLIRPVMVMREVFKAQNVPLDPMQLKILTKKIGVQNRRTTFLSDRIFQQLRYQFNDNVEFQILRRSTYVKVYSNENNLSLIQQRLKQKIKEYNNHNIMVNYRGKNIHEVVKILNQYREEQDVEYRIVFSDKTIELIGNHEVLSTLQNEIVKLVNKAKGDCAICQGIMLSPHKLFNCKHTFCKYCLVSSIRQVADDISKYPLKCPSYEICKCYLNIHDLKSLVDQQQFDKMCDRGVQKLIDNNTYHGCATQDCQMIFQVKESQSKKSYKCHLCTMHYCYQCTDIYHPGYSCKQYKQSKGPNGIEITLKKLGIKKCGKCRTPVQKNGGCNHITCTKCQSHWCWKCQKAFETQKQCYDHLAKECGGIFDQQNNEDPFQQRGLQRNINRLRQ